MTARAPGEPRRPAAEAGGRGLLGLLLLLLAGLVGPDGLGLPGPRDGDRPHAGTSADAHGVRALGEPLADALAPLGPVKAVLSAVLWTTYANTLRQGGGEDVVPVSEGLLALHPGLVAVRIHLADHLVVNEAARAPDDRRHRAYVQTGLALLEEGLERDDDPVLHRALGRLVLERAFADPRFAQAAEAYFGIPVAEVAIEELRAATAVEHPQPVDLVLLADQLVARGLDRLERFDDTWEAGRDLREAERLLGAVDHQAVDALVQRLEDLRAAWQRASDAETDES